MTTYAIPVQNIATLAGRVDALNKRAARLGVAPISCLSTGVAYSTFERKRTGEVVNRREFAEFEVAGGSLRLNGWSLLGTIEHLGEAGNVLRSVPDSAGIPEQYRTGSQACDQCGLDRKRTDTFVVAHEGGDIKQVGRACLKDFLGHIDPDRLAAWYQCLSDFARGDDEDDDAPTSHEKFTCRPDDIVAAAIGIGRVFGWVSKAQASLGSSTSTSSRVIDWLLGGKPAEALRKQGVTVDAGDYERAAAAIDWVRAGDFAFNEYLSNLAVLARAERANLRGIGLLASLPAAHERALESEATRIARAEQRAAAQTERAERAEAVPTGKVEVEGTIVGIKVLEPYAYRGPSTTKWTLQTSGGWRLYVSAPASIAECERGAKVRLTCTVEPSRDDATFGFGLRPTKASVLA